MKVNVQFNKKTFGSVHNPYATKPPHFFPTFPPAFASRCARVNRGENLYFLGDLPTDF
jgi:hypothetical protein